jgi:glycosyltransferase involved in cell wall biosynthesis
MLSILMPAYNEATSIAQNVCETVATMKASGLDFEIVVIDDGSLDGTHTAASSALREWPDHVRVVRCNRNEGKGNALICGAAYAKGDRVAFLDADMDLHPEQLAAFLEVMEARAADAVIGSKFHPASKVDYPTLRRIYSLFYFLLVRTLFGLPVRDTQTGIKLFNREVLDRVLPRILVKRFAFDLELLANIHHFGYRIVEAPVTVNFKRVGSRLRLAAVWNVFLDTMAIFYRMRILHYYDRPERTRDRAARVAGSHEVVVPIAVISD